MKMYKEVALRDFEPWSGAKDTMYTLEQLERVTGIPVFTDLEAMLEDCGCEYSETEINDFLWFENDTIAQWLGYSDWEELDAKAWEEEE